jgi:ribonuclease Y
LREIGDTDKKIAEVDTANEEVAKLKRSQFEMLEKISGYTVEEAKAYLIITLNRK